MTKVDGAMPARVRAAESLLREVLTSVSAEVTARIGERCPYRARGDRCTFAGGCRNQRREAGEGALRCAGDHRLRRRDP